MICAYLTLIVQVDLLSRRLQLKCVGTRWRTGREVKGKLANVVGTSEHGVSSITAADAHISAASSRLNWRPRRFKWTRSFRRKTKSGFCACAITFQLASSTAHSSHMFAEFTRTYTKDPPPTLGAKSRYSPPSSLIISNLQKCADNSETLQSKVRCRFTARWRYDGGR